MQLVTVDVCAMRNFPEAAAAQSQFANANPAKAVTSSVTTRGVTTRTMNVSPITATIIT
jgi:hypothetical protein